jgi:hypothetical protein
VWVRWFSLGLFFTYFVNKYNKEYIALNIYHNAHRLLSAMKWTLISGLSIRDSNNQNQSPIAVVSAERQTSFVSASDADCKTTRARHSFWDQASRQWRQFSHPMVVVGRRNKLPENVSLVPQWMSFFLKKDSI